MIRRKAPLPPERRPQVPSVSRSSSPANGLGCSESPILRRKVVSQSTQIAQVAKPQRAAPRGRAKRTKGPRGRREYSTNPDSQYLTPAEINALFAAIKTPRERAVFRIVYHRGLRAHEPGLLQLSDWNERDGLLFIRRGKNSISRDYRLTAIERKRLTKPS
jgi:integrase